MSVAEGEDEKHSAWEQRTLSKIMQQIKGIALVPGPQQSNHLSSLAEEATSASRQCSPEIAKQLSKLAEYASSRGASQQGGEAFYKHTV